MKIFKWVVLFSLSFIAAWVLIFTFTQDPFRQAVQAKIFAYRSPEIPIYWYVAGAFGFGFVLGLIALIYYFFSFRLELRRKNKKIKQLENELHEAHMKTPTIAPPQNTSDTPNPGNKNSIDSTADGDGV